MRALRALRELLQFMGKKSLEYSTIGCKEVGVRDVRAKRVQAQDQRETIIRVEREWVSSIQKMYDLDRDVASR